MSEFPKKLTGDALEILHQNVLELMSESKISCYKELFYEMSLFYGMIPLKKVFEILTESYGHTLTEEAFLRLCEFFRYEQVGNFYIFTNDEYYELDTEIDSEPMDRILAHDTYVEFDDSYEKLKYLKKGKPWYIPPETEFLSKRGGDRIENNEAYNSFINFMAEEFALTVSNAEEKTYDAVYTLKIEKHCFDDFLNELQRIGIDPSIEQVKKIVPYYIELNNNTRMAANNGYTPAEMKKLCDESGLSVDTLYINSLQIDEEHEKIRSESAIESRTKFKKMVDLFRQAVLTENNKKNMPVKSKKIGRNDPCPCGSGKKYKKCCGR